MTAVADTPKCPPLLPCPTFVPSPAPCEVVGANETEGAEVTATFWDGAKLDKTVGAEDGTELVVADGVTLGMSEGTDDG